MPFQPIKRSAISEDVTLHIMELIRSGELRPGDRLPAERQLAESLGVSRVSLREGLRTLAFMNILDVRTGDGTYISSLDSQELIEPLTFVVELNSQTFQELAQARRLIEPFLAAQAARNISDEELAELNCCLERMKAAGEDYEQVVQQDMELHRLIALAGQNTFLYRFITTLSAVVMQRPIVIHEPAWFAHTWHTHFLIVDALNRREPEAAAAAMAAHLDELAVSIKQGTEPPSPR